MQTRTLQRRHLAPLALATTALVASSPALAEGVRAGSAIDNTAQASFTIGGATQTVDSNTVTIKVDEILDVAVASLDGGTVALDSDGAVLTFQVSNVGNGPEAYEITVDPSLTGDDFDPRLVRIAFDSNGNGTYDDGVDTVIPAGGATPAIEPDESLRIFVIAEFDTPQPSDGDTAEVRLTAEAVTGTGAPGTVFAGQGVDGTDAVVGSTGASDDDIGTLIAQLSAVTLAKSATILDPFGGAQAIPGAVVTYRLVATVSGSSSIADLVVNDPIPADTTYQLGSVTLEGANQTDAADGDATVADGSGVEVDLGTVPGGASRTITFQVQIDE